MYYYDILTVSIDIISVKCGCLFVSIFVWCIPWTSYLIAGWAYVKQKRLIHIDMCDILVNLIQLQFAMIAWSDSNHIFMKRIYDKIMPIFTNEYFDYNNEGMKHMYIEITQNHRWSVLFDYFALLLLFLFFLFNHERWKFVEQRASSIIRRRSVTDICFECKYCWIKETSTTFSNIKREIIRFRNWNWVKNWFDWRLKFWFFWSSLTECIWW